MAKLLHPDYIYIDSVLLKQRVAYHKKLGWLICEDKYPDGKFVSYSPKELKVFEETGEPITMPIHRLKMFFTGEVVKYERTNGDSSNNNPDQGGQIQGASGNGKKNEGEELDIF